MKPDFVVTKVFVKFANAGKKELPKFCSLINLRKV